ncbi:hypothetical protein ES703_89087 [subsurface metagenome]
MEKEIRTEISDRMTDLNGWTLVGYYASYQIYADGDKRHVIDPTTGRLVCEYRIANNNTVPSANVKSTTKR